MSDQIDISLDQVQNTSNSIKAINKNLTAKLSDIKVALNNLSSTWRSDASETIRNRMESFSPRFQEYADVVDSYTKFLDETVKRYTDVEININSNAEAFK